MPRRRHSVATNPPVNHTRRSWSNNGVHYTLETSTYSSPNISFGMMGGTAQSPFQSIFAPAQQTPRSQGGSILGSAFGLLGNVLATQQQAAVQESARRSARHSSVDGLAYGEDEDSYQPRSFISKFAERLLNNSQRSRRPARSRDQSPPRRRTTTATEDHRSRSYCAEEREPSWAKSSAAYVDDFTDSEDDDDSEHYDEPHARQPRRAYTADNASLIEALHNAAEHHRRQVRKCRERIRQISRQPTASTSVLQSLLNELKSHEKAYETALQNLKVAKEGRGGGAGQRRAPPQSRNSQQRQQPMSSEDQYFDAFPSDNFETLFQTGGTGHPPLSDFDDFDVFIRNPFGAFHGLFNRFGTTSSLDDDIPHFFTMPRMAFSSGQRQHGAFTGSQYQQPTNFATFSTPPQSPPATLLKPEEAKRLFKAYDERWNALAPTDPNIPYPARRLQPAALTARDCIWAPMVDSPVASWSEEVVMQANTQAFFLGVVGLTPEYSEAGGTGRITMGFNKGQASQTQVKELVDILKKEKMRWHSDRLGRRNGGMAGANEALQRDEKARAVFHAVCELMEATH